jgi:hypothetical protein
MNVDAVREHLQAYLNRTLLSKHSGFQELRSVMIHHPVWGRRINDIVGMRVRKSRLNGSLQLQLKTNRIWFTVSWHKCVPRTRAVRCDAQPLEQKRLTSAMRYAVRRQAMGWKRIQGRAICCARCKSSSHLHVDHLSPPFIAIQTSFLAGRDDVPVSFDMCSKTCVSKFRKEDATFKRHWQRYHKARATYQLLCRTCNAQKGASTPSEEQSEAACEG